MKSQNSLLKSSAWSLIGVSAFCLLLICLIWNSQCKQIQHDRQATIKDVVQRNNNRVIALEQYAIRTIKNADAVLQMVIKEYARTTSPSINPLNLPTATANELFSAVLVTNEKGQLTAFNSARLVGQVKEISGQQYFRFHSRQVADSLFIGKPVLCRLLGHQVIPISRRLATPDGRFAGVVAVLIEPATFTRFYAQANLLPHDIVSLVAPDGTTYARRTGPRESFGENIRKSPLYAQVGRQPVGHYFAPDAIHGVATFFSYRRLKDYPIIATVGAAAQDVLAGYHERTQRAYHSSIMVSLLITLFWGLVCFFMLRHRRNEKVIQDSETRYRSLFENSPDAILLATPDGQVLAANPATCTIFGRSEAEIFTLNRKGLVDLSDPRMTGLLQERARTGKARGEVSLLHKEGHCFPAEVTTTLFTDAMDSQFARMFIRDITEQKRLQGQALQNHKRFQRRLTEQVIRAQEREREVIGRELHDNVNQVLTTVKLYLELAQSDKGVCDTLLPKCVGYVMDSINEIRKLSRDLSAPTLGTRSLIDSVEALVDMIRSSTGLRIILRHNMQRGALPMDIKLAVYRILQEQFNNIVRHARATKVLVTLYQQGETLVVTVKDNGQGFDLAQQSQGIGINNMISRAKVFEGRVTIDSAPGKGCMLRVCIPIPQNAGEPMGEEQLPLSEALNI